MKNKVIVSIVLVSLFFTYQNHNSFKNKGIEKNEVENFIKIVTKNQLEDKKNTKEEYNMVLEIPKLQLKKGLYLPGHILNHIDHNITVHEKTTFPDVNSESNIILMAHSGTGEKAYFNKLLQLNKDYFVNIYYKHTKYIYLINTIYEIEKTGSANIKRDINKKSVTLITCSQDDKTKQLVHIGYLIDEITY